MRSNRKRVLVGLTIMVIVAGLTCGQAEDKKQKDQQARKLEAELARVLSVSADGGGISYSVWTVTAVPSATVNKCTADNPWQNLYTRKTSTNDQIRFKSAIGPYTIHFTLGTPLNDMNGNAANDIPVPAAGFSAMYVAQNVTCTDKDGNPVPCAYPYNILMNGVTQCNNSTSPPDNGSDGLVVKCGPGC